ncbi:MAG: dTDP-4-dehydrorhamnose 3,5-epimerase [Desulfovibrio sp.]|nr:dTDP-4-dehydrorhamnose 3,5-epimerase [Desulfovibrio sp.]
MAAVKQHLPLQTGLQQTCIEGVVLQELQIIATAGGPVLHMLKAGSPLVPDFSCGFGEIYFSEVVPGAVKAWKCHRRQSQLFAVPHGLLQIVLYDGRSASASQGCCCEILLGRPDNYALLRIPPGIWYGFTAKGQEPALICNCADLPHDPAEGERLPVDSPLIPWRWEGA